MKEKKTERRVGIGFAEDLTLLFIALRLCGVISWSWVWVLSPLWITIALIAVIALIIIMLK